VTAVVVFLSDYRGRPSRLLMLLRRVAAADQAAFARLYLALEPEVAETVHRQLGGGGDQAGEIAAATFLEAWQYADLHTSPGTDVAGWITGIAARRAGEQHDPRTRSHPSRSGHSAEVALAALLDHQPVRRSPFRRG
jgi:DNA-directed RNA polymerase specialized sigma24 family protein